MVQEEMRVAGPGLWGRRCREADSLGPGLNQGFAEGVVCRLQGRTLDLTLPSPSLPSGPRKSR